MPKRGVLSQEVTEGLGVGLGTLQGELLRSSCLRSCSLLQQLLSLQSPRQQQARFLALPHGRAQLLLHVLVRVEQGNRRAGFVEVMAASIGCGGGEAGDLRFELGELGCELAVCVLGCGGMQ
jgi:hypothetical protein